MDIFTNKVAIVTGSASGIGRALSQELAQRGANVILADMNAGLLAETTQSIVNAGYKAKAVGLDVTDFEAIKKLVDDTVTEYGQLNYIFNNAGVTIVSDAKDYIIDDWRKVIDTNLYGVINGVTAAYPIMVKQGFGQIVNTSSLAGLIPEAGEVPYSTSKYGIVGLSNALRIAGMSHGVKVNVVCPGYIQTPIFETMKLRNLDRQKLINALPKMMSAEECAQVILRGVERNKAIILVTTLAKVFWIAQRISPGFVRWSSGRLIEKIGKRARIEG